MKNSHIRITLLVAIAVLFSFIACNQEKEKQAKNVTQEKLTKNQQQSIDMYFNAHPSAERIDSTTQKNLFQIFCTVRDTLRAIGFTELKIDQLYDMLEYDTKIILKGNTLIFKMHNKLWDRYHDVYPESQYAFNADGSILIEWEHEGTSYLDETISMNGGIIHFYLDNANYLNFSHNEGQIVIGGRYKTGTATEAASDMITDMYALRNRMNGVSDNVTNPRMN